MYNTYTGIVLSSYYLAITLPKIKSKNKKYCVTDWYGTGTELQAVRYRYVNKAMVAIGCCMILLS